MGIVFNRKIGYGYKSKSVWSPELSLPRAVKKSIPRAAKKKLKPQNQKFLISLGLRLRR